jgi:hypothetical protein
MSENIRGLLALFVMFGLLFNASLQAGRKEYGWAIWNFGIFLFCLGLFLIECFKNL